MLLSGQSIYIPSVVNHSDLLNSGVNTHDQIDAFISSKAQNSGLAPLDGTGKIPLTHLPTSSQTFKGLWNAQTNTPPLLDNGVGGVLGDYYIVNVTGSTLVDGINTWQIGDWIIHSGAKWERIDQPDPELVDAGTEYKTVQNKPIFNNSVPSDPSHLVQKLYADGIQTNLQNQINTKIPTSEKGVANGVATLDGSTKLTISQIPQIDHTTLSNIGVRNHSIIDIDLDDHTNRLNNIEPKIQNIISGDALETKFNDKKITTSIPVANIVDNDQLTTKQYVDQQDNVQNVNINNHINDLTIHRVINDAGTSDVDLFSAQKILALDSAQQALINTNTLNISNIQTEQTTQNNRLNVIEAEQITQNNNILTNTNNITSNDNDILILQQQQGVQDNAITNNASNISTNSANIGVLQSKTSKLNINGNPDSILSYNVAIVPSLASDIVPKSYVDGITSAIQSALRYCGTYDALNNLPNLISNPPYIDGCYHIVNVEGNQDLGQGPILWGVGDWVIRQAGTWARIEYSSQEIINLQNQITANLNAIQSNDNDITNLQNADVNLQNQITSNDNDILNLQNKTQNITNADLTGTYFNDKPIYNNVPVITAPNQIPTKGYVDGQDGALQGQINGNLSSINTLNAKTQKFNLSGEPDSVLTYANAPVIVSDNNLINKKYVDDAITVLQAGDLTTLNNKTQKLSTSGDIAVSILPSVDNSIDIGTNLIRFKDGYFSNILRSDTTLNSNNLLNTSNNIGVTISNDINGQVSFNSTALYANGNTNRAVIMGATGEFNKTGVIITNQNVEAKDITCQKIIGNNTNGQNDLVLNNQAGKGLIIKDGANGNICLDGDSYTANAGKYLKIDDNKGLIVADIPPTGGDVVGSTTSLLNQVPRYTDASGKIIKNSLVTVSDTGRLYAPELDGVLLAVICQGLSMKGDITPELNTDIINLGSGTLPIAKLYLNSAAGGGVYIDNVLQTFGINGITSTENPVSSGQYDISFSSTQYQTPGTLKVDAAGKIYVVPDNLSIAYHDFTTPYNVSQHPDFVITVSSTFDNNTTSYGPQTLFDDDTGMSGWYSFANTYDGSGNPTTGIIAPMTTPGSWASVNFSSNKIISKIKIKPGGFGNYPVDFTIHRYDGATWINTGFSVVGWSGQIPNVYSEWTIPPGNGGGQNIWQGIAVVVSKVIPIGNLYCEIAELDFLSA